MVGDRHTASVASRNMHFVISNSSYEDDGSAYNMSFMTNAGGSNYAPLGKSAPSVIYDKDGTLTRHVGGKAGSTVIPNHSYYYNTQDFKPASWGVRVSNDRYALMRMANVGGSDTAFRVTTPDGDVATNKPSNNQYAGTNALVKLNDGQYTVSFPDGLNSILDGFDIQFFISAGPISGSTMVKFSGIGNYFKVSNRPQVNNLNSLRAAKGTSFAIAGNDLYVKFFTTKQSWFKTQFRKK